MDTKKWFLYETYISKYQNVYWSAVEELFIEYMTQGWLIDVNKRNLKWYLEVKMLRISSTQGAKATLGPRVEPLALRV